MNSKFYEDFINGKLYFDKTSVLKAYDYLESRPSDSIEELQKSFKAQFIDNFIEGERSSCIKGSKQYSDFKNSAEKYFAKERPVMDATLRTVYDNQGGFNNVTYVLLKPRISAEAFNKKRLLMDDKYMAPIFASSI